MGNCNKCDLGLYESQNEINRFSLNYPNTNLINDNKNEKQDITRYKKYEPEIIFLQLKIRKLLLCKKMNQKEYFYYQNYNNLENMSITDNNIIQTEDQNFDSKNNFFNNSTNNQSVNVNYPKYKNMEKFKSLSQKYNSITGDDSNENINSGIIFKKYQVNEDKVYQVTKFRINNNSIYTGSMLNGKQHGYGKQEWDDGARYEGEWKNGKTCGYGTFYHSDGDIYKGYWKDDKANGQGIYISIDGVKYDGQWVDDTQDGYGIETWNDGSEYKGYYKEGKKKGKGEYSWPDGSKYKGNWDNNNQDGYGIYIWPDKKKYEGNFKNNTLHGYGHYSWPDGREYFGMFIMGKREGIGKYYWSDGRSFVGFWENGKQHGLGKYINLEKQVKWGIWINGRRNRWISDEQIQTLEEEDDEFLKQIEEFDENNFKINS